MEEERRNHHRRDFVQLRHAGSDSGSKFTVTINNGVGSATSTAASLTVNTAVIAPAISSQPTSQTVVAGQSANFSATVTGTTPVTYQWMKNGVAISGATSSSYSVASTTTTDNGALFSLVARNTAGSATSNSATLTVTQAQTLVAPSISFQPANQSVTVGAAASFAVAATGSSPFSYKWNKNGVAIAGASAATYTTPVTTSSDNGAQFTVSVSNSTGTVLSNVATLTVTAAPATAGCVTSSGTWVNSTLPQTQTSNFRLTYDATPATTGIDAVTGLSSGAASDFSNLAAVARFNSSGMIDALNGASYTALSALPYAAGTTYHFILDVNMAAHTYTVTVQVGSLQTIIGSNLAFRTVQSTISSLNSVAAMTSPGTHTVCKIATSTAAATAPAIATQPLNQTVAAGQAASFSVSATGTAPFTYQWKQNGAAISGATASNYITPATTTANSGSLFSVTITNAAGNVTSNGATLTVTAAATLLLNSSVSSLNFGNVNVSSSSSQNITVTNAGNSNITISQVIVSGAGFNTGGGAAGLILSPGQTAVVSATFTPSASGAASGSVAVSSNATNSPSTVGLTGTGVTPVTHSVALSWTPGSGVIGYNTYVGSISGGPYIRLSTNAVTGSSYVDNSVQSGHSYYYVVTALNSANQESIYSSEVAAILP